MAAKNSGENDFWQKVPDDSVYTLWANNFPRLLHLCAKFEVTPPNGY